MSGLPIKSELASILHSVEEATKKGVMAVQSDLFQVLIRVDECEQRLDHHAAAIYELQAHTRRLTHRMSLYKIEDQENLNRGNTIRIRGLPGEIRNGDLQGTVRGIFNLFGNPTDHPLKLYHVHRALCPCNLATDAPRDVICQVHYYE